MRPLTQQLRKIMVQRMAKPEEVIVVENEQGEVVREVIKDTDAMNLYKSMRESLGRQLQGAGGFVWPHPVGMELLSGGGGGGGRGCSVLCHFITGAVYTVYLTHLDYEDTERIMTDKLYRQVDGSEWSWKNLNTVSQSLSLRTRVCICIHCMRTMLIGACRCGVQSQPICVYLDAFHKCLQSTCLLLRVSLIR